jgi:hypothetical protein
MYELSRINWMSVIVATIVGYGLGAIWFNQKVFGEAWMTDLGVPRETLMKGSMVRSMGINFVMTLLTAVGVAWLIRLTGAKSLVGGTKVGLLCAFAFVVTSYIGDAAYAQTRNRFVSITAGYRALMIVLMGAILGYWH